LNVIARRYVTRGEVHVVLEDLATGRISRIGEREWTVLRSADGTRDIEGILAAAARDGRAATREHLVAFLDELGRQGMLAHGVEVTDRELSAAGGLDEMVAVTEQQLAERLSERADRPIDPLPGYRLSCDGKGACCEVFPTVLFAPHEALGARATCPGVLAGGDREDAVFTPERSAQLHGDASARGVRAAALIDGHCAYLAPDRRCLLHDTRAKPFGCTIFPRCHVDDGAAIRVSVLPDCACVFESLGRDDGEPLVPPGARYGRDLDPGVHVRRLAAMIDVSPHLREEREAYVEWSRGLIGEIRGQPLMDVPGALWSLACAVDVHGLSSEAIRDALGEPRPIDPESIAVWLRALGSLASIRGSQVAAWRAEDDIVRTTIDRIQWACDVLLRDLEQATASAGEHTRRDEALYVDTVLHGHQIIDGRPLVTSLRDRAVRLLVARVLPLEHPIALVEPMMRAHGLASYTDHLGGTR
jgi:lysine-N-methylase